MIQGEERRNKMRVYRLSVMAAAAMLVAATAAVAWASEPKVDVNAGGVHVEVGAKNMTGDETNVVRVKDLIGLSVRSATNENLGQIEDLVIAPTTGRIRYAVLSFGGGILDLGTSKYFAVPWNRLTFITKGETTAGTPKDAYCLLDISKEALKEAPGFDKNHWPDFASNNWNIVVDQFYGKQRQANREMRREDRKQR
jgi:sporulation protein YlmC with PRC-barrel domain